MAVVAVLEIHMDKNAVASMNPSISLGGLVPMTINTLKIGFFRTDIISHSTAVQAEIDLIKKSGPKQKTSTAHGRR